MKYNEKLTQIQMQLNNSTLLLCNSIEKQWKTTQLQRQLNNSTHKKRVSKTSFFLRSKCNYGIWQIWYLRLRKTFRRNMWKFSPKCFRISQNFCVSLHLSTLTAYLCSLSESNKWLNFQNLRLLDSLMIKGQNILVIVLVLV